MVGRPLGYHDTLARLQWIVRTISGNLPYILCKDIVLGILYLEIVGGHPVDGIIILDLGDAELVEIDHRIGIVVDLVELVAEVVSGTAGVENFMTTL